MDVDAVTKVLLLTFPPPCQRATSRLPLPLGHHFRLYRLPASNLPLHRAGAEGVLLRRRYLAGSFLHLSQPVLRRAALCQRLHHHQPLHHCRSLGSERFQQRNRGNDVSELQFNQH